MGYTFGEQSVLHGMGLANQEGGETLLLFPLVGFPRAFTGMPCYGFYHFAPVGVVFVPHEAGSLFDGLLVCIPAVLEALVLGL